MLIFLREIYENLYKVTPHLARVGGYAICIFLPLSFLYLRVYIKQCPNLSRAEAICLILDNFIRKEVFLPRILVPPNNVALVLSLSLSLKHYFH